MGFEWDRSKASSNASKHGVRFNDAVAVFFDSLARTVSNESAEEDRLVTMGMDALGRLLVGVHAWRGENVRIISARRATHLERKQYEG